MVSSDFSSSGEEYRQLFQQAVEGDRLALQRLLIPFQSRLITHIRKKLPAFLAESMAPEDVLQETYVDVFRCIGGLEDQGPKAFYRWLLTLAEHRVTDAIRSRRAAKRGGTRNRVDPTQSSVAPLLDLIHADSHTPSRSVGKREMALAIHLALAGLKAEYREALTLRFIEGMSVSEAADRMGKSEFAIHKLCSRGLLRLRESLGEASKFFSVR